MISIGRALQKGSTPTSKRYSCEGSAIQNGKALLLVSLPADSDDHCSTNIVICADMANAFLTFRTGHGGDSNGFLLNLRLKLHLLNAVCPDHTSHCCHHPLGDDSSLVQKNE